jgi:hypothetical protein
MPFRRFAASRQTITLKLFNRTSKARNKWRRKAWLVDPNKTRIVFQVMEKREHVPPWLDKKLDQSN